MQFLDYLKKKKNKSNDEQHNKTVYAVRELFASSFGFD
jgi:hypothetical protein